MPLSRVTIPALALAMLLAAPASAQISPDTLAHADRLFTDPGPLAETRALLIVQGGKPVYERYREGYDADQRHVSWSMAKSITSAIVGHLVQQGLIDIHDPMPSPFAEGDPRAELTWHHYLTMTDGLDYTEIVEEGVDVPLSEQDVVQMMYGLGRYDVVAWIADNIPALHDPGTRWNYSTAGYHLLGHAIQDVIGTSADPEATTEWLRANIFAPLGMDSAVAEYDAAGTLLGGSLVYATARDFARFGQLYLDDGILTNGTRFLPDGWVDYARTGELGDDHNIYGAGFWPSVEEPSAERSTMSAPFDAFHAGGHEGQTIWIVPSRDLVTVRLGLMPNSPESWSALFEANQAIARGFAEMHSDTGAVPAR